MRRISAWMILFTCFAAVVVWAQTDPSQDDWTAERLVQPAVAQLDRVGQWVVAAGSGTPLPELSGLFAEGARFGDLVPRGQTVARLGNTGRSSAPHVHFEVRLDDEPLDPAYLLSAES